MKLAIMQPYFFPYIGYFQLMNAVDEFVVYDNIEFTKKGWIHRNRILVNGNDSFMTLPLKNDSDFLHVNQRFLADNWTQERIKILNRIKEAYRKAPYFQQVYPLLETCFMYPDTNLFQFILHSLQSIKNYLNIQTPLIISSSIPINHSLKSVDKVIGLCMARKASIYINPIGGQSLYHKTDFDAHEIHLKFLQTNSFHYTQFNNEYVPFLSILDVMMFNSTEIIQELLSTQFTLLD